MATSISGSTGVTFPAGGVGNTAGAAVGTTDTQTLTNKTLGSGLVAGASLITSGTAVASTSGTSIDFTSLPAWVKRITVMFNGVSTSGTSNHLIQLGAGSVTSSGYTSTGLNLANAASPSSTTSSSGFILGDIASASAVIIGYMMITNVSGNIWIASGTGRHSGTACFTNGGSISLAGTLDRVRITTVNGTDTFDAGSINILFE